MWCFLPLSFGIWTMITALHFSRSKSALEVEFLSSIEVEIVVYVIYDVYALG